MLENFVDLFRRSLTASDQSRAEAGQDVAIQRPAGFVSANNEDGGGTVHRPKPFPTFRRVGLESFVVAGQVVPNFLKGNPSSVGEDAVAEGVICGCFGEVVPTSYGQGIAELLEGEFKYRCCCCVLHVCKVSDGFGKGKRIPVLFSGLSVFVPDLVLNGGPVRLFGPGLNHGVDLFYGKAAGHGPYPVQAPVCVGHLLLQ